MPAATAFSTLSTLDGDYATIAVTGELDLRTVHRLEMTVASVFDLGIREVALDLGGVTFLDSTGLGCLVGLHLRCEEGQSIHLTACSPAAAELLDITGLRRVLAEQR